MQSAVFSFFFFVIEFIYFFIRISCPVKNVKYLVDIR